MSNQINKEILDKIFISSPINNKYIGSRESGWLEFKENFSFAGIGDYAKTMAAFANNKGGYLVFGVRDKPREIIGVDSKKFDSIDVAKLTEKLNDIFSPEIEWDLLIHNWNKTDFGIIYTHESQSKPIISKKVHDDIKEADIFYRYHGRTERIKFGELSHIISRRVEIEKKAWMDVFKRASDIGPQNVAMLDTLKGKIEGLGRTILIDEKLLPQLKFIKKGEFKEEKGEIALKLVGELKTVPVTALKEKRVVVGEDIYIYRASDVCREVKKTIKSDFRPGSEHLKAWRKHKIRVSGKPTTIPFKNEYCEYKLAERDYRYSQAWIDLLINEYSDKAKYKKLRSMPVSSL